MNDKECPAEPVVGDNGTGARRGGFAKIAERLNELHPSRQRPVSRQLVHKWWMYRHFNAFPAAIDSTGSPGTSGGKGRPIFDIAAVEAWHAHYIQTRHRPTQAQHTAPAQASEDGDSLAA